MALECLDSAEEIKTEGKCLSYKIHYAEADSDIFEDLAQTTFDQEALTHLFLL